MIVIKQNISKNVSDKSSVDVSDVKKVTFARTVTPEGVFYKTNLYFYSEAAFVIVNNYLVSSSQYTFVKLDAGDYNAVKFNTDPGVNSVIEVIAAYKA